MKRTRFASIISILALLFIGGCSDNESGERHQKNPPIDDPVEPVEEIVVDVSKSIDSVNGCHIDADCVSGAFCFQGQCVVECNEAIVCDAGYVCQMTRGRCVNESFLPEVVAALKKIEDGNESLSDHDRAMILSELDLKAANNSDVRVSVLGSKNESGEKIKSVELVNRIPNEIHRGQVGKGLTFEVRQSVGPVFYAVKTSDNALPLLKKAHGARTANGNYRYNLEIDADEALKSRKRMTRDGGDLAEDAVVLDVVTSIGNESVVITETHDLSSVYSGYVVPFSVLSGIDLPIRMAIEVYPKQARSFEEIESVKLYLPISNEDIFSPENVKSPEGNIEWTGVEIVKKDDASNCSGGKACFAAAFSTNDFHQSGSVILSKDEHVNRNIRIEIDGYDADSVTFSGLITDKFEGLYRELVPGKDGQEGTQQWNVTQLGGYFNVIKSSAIPEGMNKHLHQADNMKVREISEQSTRICSDSDISALIGYVKNSWPEGCVGLEEKDAVQCEKYDICTHLKTYKDYESLANEEKLFCVQAAVNEILSDGSRVSAILERVLVTDASGEKDSEDINVCGQKISNFDDFRKVCSDSECDLCKEHSELACAGDLLAKIYKDDISLDTDSKADLARNWIKIMKESYLAQQYLAWNQDTEIRKSWLEGAVYSGTFAAATMDSFNNKLLKRYQNEVLDVQRTVLKKQFVQSTLEMLSQSAVDSVSSKVNDFSSLRNGILSEISSNWESTAGSLGLAARRYDVLVQNDSERLSAASNLRPVLFDLYLSGLVASSLNLKADQGSLNGAFGANLSSAISKLKSLDQTFESLVFMRDGEIFVDTRLDTDGDETALERVKLAARSSVNKAENKKKDVFAAIEKQNEEKQSVKDSYMSALENIRTHIVDLCGYPSDCTTLEQRKTCQVFTAPFFCGLSIPSIETKGVDLSEFVSSTKEIEQASIGQAADLNACMEKYTQYQDGRINSLNEKDVHSCFGYDLNDLSISLSGGVDSNISKAGIAIQAFRQAVLEYETAKAEYEIHLQKVNNSYETLDAYARSISKQFTNMSETLDAIGKSLEKIKQYEKAIFNYQIKISDENISALKKEYNNKLTEVLAWEGIQAVGTAVSDYYSITGIKNAIKSIEGETSKRGDNLDMDPAVANQRGISGLMDYVGYTSAVAALSFASTQYYLHNPGGAVMGNLESVASSYMNTYINLSLALSDNRIYSKKASILNNANSLLTSTFNLATTGLNKGMSVDASDVQLELSETINSLKSAVNLHKEGCESNKTSSECIENKELGSDEMKIMIADLERQNQLLFKMMEYEDERNHQLEELENGRNQLLNDVLDLIAFERMVYVKDLEVSQKHTEYLQISQEALELANQFDNKLARFNSYRDLLGSASSFFQYAADLEDVEKYMEYARNDLMDYLAAIEYLTVRPFVELRRSIYMARGTNDLSMLYENLNDLTNNCGSGKRSQNKVKLSVRNRLGLVDDEFGGISSEEKMMLMNRSGQMMSDAELRYVKNEELSDLILSGRYFNSSFSLTPKFSNISNSCDAKIEEIQVRLVSMEGKPLRNEDDATPKVVLVYGGQSQLMSCHDNIDAIASSVGARTSFGKFSTFHSEPLSDGLNAGVYEVSEGENYVLSDKSEFIGKTSSKALKGYPLMATYSIMIDPESGENSQILWENLADIEIQISYTTGTLGTDSSKCNYDM